MFGKMDASNVQKLLSLVETKARVLRPQLSPPGHSSSSTLDIVASLFKSESAFHRELEKLQRAADEELGGSSHPCFLTSIDFNKRIFSVTQLVFASEVRKASMLCLFSNQPACLGRSIVVQHFFHYEVDWGRFKRGTPSS